jgi:hypothetical protein
MVAPRFLRVLSVPADDDASRRVEVDVTLVGLPMVVEVLAVSPEKEWWMTPAAALIPSPGFQTLDESVVVVARADTSSATFAPESGEGTVVEPPARTRPLCASKLWPAAAPGSGMSCVVAVVAGGLT